MTKISSTSHPFKSVRLKIQSKNLMYNYYNTIFFPYHDTTTSMYYEKTTDCFYLTTNNSKAQRTKSSLYLVDKTK